MRKFRTLAAVVALAAVAIVVPASAQAATDLGQRVSSTSGPQFQWNWKG
jgi:Spy/CpxP family protein refolding chaperone